MTITLQFRENLGRMFHQIDPIHAAHEDVTNHQIENVVRIC